MHHTLKELTSSYIVCKECYDLGNFPKVFNPEDFSAMTMKSMFSDKSSIEKSNEASEAVVQNEVSYEESSKSKFSAEDKEKLIAAVTE